MFFPSASLNSVDDIYTVRWSATIAHPGAGLRILEGKRVHRADDWQPAFPPAVPFVKTLRKPSFSSAAIVVPPRPGWTSTHMRTSNSGTSEGRRQAAGHS
jgi:hypothetical protein